MDGTLGSRTARLLDGSGVEITSAEALCEIVRRAAAAGFPVAVHAIGDRANREALDAFAATRADWRGLRPRIEHAQCVHPVDVPRFAALGVAASVQYAHATSDRDVADRLWGERAAHAYPYRSLLDAGTVLAGGSDAPVEELDPLAGLRAAVRRTDGERPPWRPEQAIGAAAALASYTTAPAWLAGEEGLRGRLAPGLLADLVGARPRPARRPRRAGCSAPCWPGAGPSDLQEAHDAPADLDLVAVAQARLAHALAVDVDAVAAAVVGDHGRAVALEHERVAAGDRRVVEHDVGAGAAADAGDPAEAQDDHLLPVRDGEVAARRQRPDRGRGEARPVQQRARAQEGGRGLGRGRAVRSGGRALSWPAERSRTKPRIA